MSTKSWLVGILLSCVGMAASAQSLSLEGLDGSRLTDADLSRGNAVVVLWASWSPRGRDIAERINALARETGDRATVLAVNYQEDAGAVRQFVAAHALNVRVFLDIDGALAKRYKIATLPGLLVLKSGEIAYQGRMPEDAERVVDDSLK